MSPEEYMLYCPNWLPAGGNLVVFHVGRERQPHHVLTHDHPPQLSPGQDPLLSFWVGTFTQVLGPTYICPIFLSNNGSFSFQDPRPI